MPSQRYVKGKDAGTSTLVTSEFDLREKHLPPVASMFAAALGERRASAGSGQKC